MRRFILPLMLLFVFGMAALGLFLVKGSASVTPGPNVTTTPVVAVVDPSQAAVDDHAAIVAALGVKDPGVHCADLVPADNRSSVDGDMLVEWDIAAPAKKAVPGSHDSNHRIANDAIGTPVLATKEPDQNKELERAICQDPNLGISWAWWLAHLDIHGTNVADIEANKSWLGPYKDLDVSGVNDKALAFVPLYGVTDPNKVSTSEASDAKTQNLAYQQLAGYVDTLIERFTVGKSDSAGSSRNMDLVSDVIASGLPEVQINPKQESKPVRHLLFTVKGTCVADTDIGFNLLDKRPEQFTTAKCVAPAKSPSPKCTASCGSSGKPGCTSGCTTTRPGCTSNCGHTTPPTTCSVCVSKTAAGQPVPKPAYTGSVNKTAPPERKPVPVRTENPPPPTKGGYDGGSKTQPGATAPPAHPLPSATTATGDPGGF